MSDLIIPPHLKVAENVTEEEYASAIRERRMIVIILIVASLLLILPCIWFYGILGGTALMVVLVVALERVLNKILKNAHKMRTIRMVRYKELRLYREKMRLIKDKENSPTS